MTITGYVIEGLGDNDAQHVCPQCVDPFDVHADGRRIKEITTRQFRHGNGGGHCVICGFDTLDTLSGRALDDTWDTERSKIPHADPPESLTPYADVFDAITDAFVTIRLGPGVEPERVEVVPGVKQVSHPDDASETLVLEFEREDTDTERAEICNKIMGLLAFTPLNATYCPNNRGDDQSDAIIAAEP